MTKRFLAILVKDIFIISFITYIVLFILEWYKTGLVTNYFNINIVLIICLISGIITSLVFKSDSGKSVVKKILYYIFYLILAVIFGILIYNILTYSGRKEILLAIISGVVLFCSLTLIYKND